MTEPFLITNKDKVLRTLQLVELEGLMEIDRICRKHGIEYSLGGGTCLGRVRHGGFIPWDDDIDVDMAVENYDKFMEVAPEEIDSNRFFLRCRKTDAKHYRTAAKLEIKDTVLEFGGWKNDEETDYYIYSKCESRGFVTVAKNKLPIFKQYNENETTEMLIERLSKRYVGCFLNYYDNDDYQLSVLRYDEKEERMLSNEEIFSGKRQ